MKFNFNACDFKNYLKDALANFQFDGEMDAILDKYLDLNQVPILPTSLTTSIKNKIVLAADSKVNMIKQGIIAKIDGIQCSIRHLETYEVDSYGSQRMLGNDLTFKPLENAIMSIDPSVQSVSAGYFPGRAEVAIDVDIHLEEDFNDNNDFQTALVTVFGYLDDAKAMFGAEGVDANVAGLLNNAHAVIDFDLSIR